MYELTQDEKLHLLEKRKIGYSVIQDGDISKSQHCDYYQILPTRRIHRCWCKFNKGKLIEDGPICLFCGADTTWPRVANKNVIVKTAKPSRTSEKEHITLDSFFYVRKHPDKENGIEILKLTLTLKSGKTSNDEETLDWKINHLIEIIPNEECRAYKLSHGQEVAVDMFDAFQINSKLIKEYPIIEFEDSIGAIDFMLNYKKFNQYTGFMQCFNLADVVIHRNAFFMLYMYLYAQYPAVEFVVKMGYVSLMSHIMRELINGCNKEQIRAKANLLTKILNSEAKNGSMALTVPRYIADDLNEKDARIDEYIAWGDIHQLSGAKSTSKENYIESTRNRVYHQLYYCYREIPNIMKFGYSVKDIIKYVEKQMNIDGHGAIWIFREFADYLNMCDLMGIEHDKFPSNIVSAHDNVSKAFMAKKDVMSDKAIALVAKEAEKHIPVNEKYMNSDYVITLPHSINDVVQEGQSQHNCVGSYVSKIVERRSIVFFVRKKDEPEQSFVTAEFKNGRLNQIFYKNNRHVTDQEIREIANDFCNSLSKTNIITV